MITLAIIAALVTLILGAGGFLAITDVSGQEPLTGRLKMQTKDIDGQAAYVAATGHVLNASDFGLTVIRMAIVSDPLNSTTSARTYWLAKYLRAPVKGSAQEGSSQLLIVFHNISDGLETGNGDLSAQSFRVTVFGY